MAIINVIKKTADDNGIYQYVEQCDDASYPTTDWEHDPDVSGVSAVSRNYWAYNGSNTVVEMGQVLKDAVDKSLLNSLSLSQGSSSQAIPLAGRFYMYTDRRWVTDSDDNYGTGQFQFNESGGTGNDPLLEWEHQGVFIPAGTIIRGLVMGGRSNNNEVGDVEISINLRKPNLITGWESGYDADGEMTNTEIFRNNFLAPSDEVAYTGNSNDYHRRKYNFNELVEDDSFLSIYMRPVGTPTATRYFLSTYQWELISAR